MEDPGYLRIINWISVINHVGKLSNKRKLQTILAFKIWKLIKLSD